METCGSGEELEARTTRVDVEGLLVLKFLLKIVFSPHPHSVCECYVSYMIEVPPQRRMSHLPTCFISMVITYNNIVRP